ncbi:MAG: hypothetical protein ABIY52_15785 [Gemmatimonadaceae bacterium]
MRRLVVLMSLLAAAVPAESQIVRPRFQVSAPAAWVSASIGQQGAFSLRDGTSGSTWEFGSSNPIGVSLEKGFTNGVSAGVRGSTAQVPLRYTGASAVYDAEARVSQLLATMRVAPGQQFHTVLELSAGVTYFSEFHTQAEATKLAPLTGDQDFTYAFGYGFGYAFSPRFAVDVVQDVTTVLHQKDGLSASDDASHRFSVTRLVARIGLGGH